MTITLPSLSALSGIRHAFFTRDGGVSSGIYATLNGGIGSKDAAAHVVENRSRMARILPAAASDVTVTWPFFP